MKKNLSILTILVGGGIAAVILGFMLDKFAGPLLTANPVAADNIAVMAKVESDLIIFYVKNDSDEILDIEKVDVKVSFHPPKRLGAYPEISHIYSDDDIVVSNAVRESGTFQFTVNLVQYVEPRGRDQFAIKLLGMNPQSVSDVSGTLSDDEGRNFRIDRRD